MDLSMMHKQNMFMCCDVTNQHIDIIERGSLIPMFYYLYTFHTFRAFSSEIQRCCVVIEQKIAIVSVFK